ncbi:hypothetical protein ABH927_006582 [Planotetraspora sp. GP83]
MASHKLIDRHLQALAERLPAPMAEELADGLTEAYENQLDRLGDPDAAARAALADFGDVDTITAAFVRVSPGRGTALRLLSAGPVVGLSWGAALIAGQAWRWPVPLAPRLIFGSLLALAGLTLFVAVRERHCYRTVRLAALTGASGLVILDAVRQAQRRPEGLRRAAQAVDRRASLRPPDARPPPGPRL